VAQGTSDAPTCVQPTPDPRAVIAVLMAGTFLAPLDSSIVNIALPAIASGFQVRLAAVGWVATAYLLTNASLVLVMGRLGDLWGIRRIYVTGFAVFGAGSLACALSPSLGWLIAARILQAVGASMIFAASPALVVRTFPPRRRGWALGWISLAVSAGLTAGPSLGGVLLGTFGWPSIFLINLPLVVLVIAAAKRLLPSDCPVEEPFDLLGAALGALALTSLLVGLSEVDRRGILSPFVLGAVALAAVAGAAFVMVERRLEHPMMDLSLFSSRSFSAGVAAAVLSYMSLFAITFTMPFYLLQVRGIEPGLAGLVLTATPLSMALFSPLAGRLSDSWGSRGLATGGMVWLALSVAVASRVSQATPLWAIAATLFSIGTGLSVFTAPNTAAILRATPQHRVGVGSALTSQARNVGMTLGISVTAAIMSTMLGGRELIRGEGALPPADAAAFLDALQPALVVAAAVAAAGAFVSWLRTHDGVRDDEVEPPQTVP